MFVEWIGVSGNPTRELGGILEQLICWMLQWVWMEAKSGRMLMPMVGLWSRIQSWFATLWNSNHNAESASQCSSAVSKEDKETSYASIFPSAMLPPPSRNIGGQTPCYDFSVFVSGEGRNIGGRIPCYDFDVFVFGFASGDLFDSVKVQKMVKDSKKIVKDRKISQKITKDYNVTLYFIKDCKRLQNIAQHYERLRKIVKDCERLQKIANDCRRLQKTAEDCKRWQDIAKDCTSL